MGYWVYDDETGEPTWHRFKVPLKVYKYWAFLRMWLSLIHADISWYGGLPDGTDFLDWRTALQIAKGVWLE